MTEPAPCAAERAPPRLAASMTPPSPPVSTRKPASTRAKPSRSASAYVGVPSATVPSPITATIGEGLGMR